MAHACAGDLAYKHDAGISGEYSHALLKNDRAYGFLTPLNYSADWAPYVSPDFDCCEERDVADLSTHPYESMLYAENACTGNKYSGLKPYDVSSRLNTRSGYYLGLTYEEFYPDWE